MEIGGYIELSRYSRPMLHEQAIALNSARNCLAYLIEAKRIKRIAVPKFLCDSVAQVCGDLRVELHRYEVGIDFLPSGLTLKENEWLYLVNYYGQISDRQICAFKRSHDKLIVDNVQAYYQMPIEGVDTIYTCRKYFGVADGAFLYTDARLDRQLEPDNVYDRMRHLLGRFEANAREFYADYRRNEEAFVHRPLRQMSQVSCNLLHSIDYEDVKRRRERNFMYLQKYLQTVNKLKLQIPEGPFMYPLYIENGAVIRERLHEKDIYISVLWPDVFTHCDEGCLEYDMAKNILPIPVDQRYGKREMDYLISEILSCIS